MNDLLERLKRGAEILERLGQKQAEHSMTAEDYDEEYGILITELWDLEEDIVTDPGALQACLVPAPRPGQPVDPQ